MAGETRLTADDLRQKAETSRLMALYSPTARRVSAGRVPTPPAAAPELERPKESIAGDVAGVIGGVGSLAGTAVSFAVNPLLGALVGMFAGLAGSGVGKNIAAQEAREAEQVAHRNRKAMGQAQLEQQRYASELARSREQVPSPAPVMPRAQAAQGEDIQAGAVQRQQSLLMG